MPRARRALAAALLGIAAMAGVAQDAAPAAAAGCPSILGGSFASQLAQRYPGIRVTAAVYDTQTGCWHHLNPGAQLTTASVIKAQVLGAVLLKAQDEGRGLTAWERSQISPMIRLSFNPETSNLYGHLASWGGIGASDGRFGVTSTSHVRPFGITRSTATDRTNVALRLLHGGGGLAQAGRQEAWAYLSSVHPLQEWGISAGVPDGWSVAQKNGFYPAAGLGWRVGSSGFVRRDVADQGYAITVMTEGASTQRTGIRLVEEVARRVAASLTVGPGASRPVDRARCVQASGEDSWSSLTARLGLPASRTGEVRAAAGGDSPHFGQQVCSPDIPSEPRAASSTVGGRYRPVSTDLDCDGRSDVLWYGPGSAADSRWAGHPDRRFRGRTLSVRGEYVPVAGDFDGDGCGDVLWYGPGIAPDSVWYGGGSSTRVVSVQGTGYWPVAGDFDGDGRDDVLWYGPGAVADSLWSGTSARGTFAKTPLSVAGAYQPLVGDYDGDAAADVLWYAPGGTADPMWAGRPGARGVFDRSSTSVTGRYRPVTAQLDGDVADELVWYAPGGAADSRWDGLPPGHASTPLSIGGAYLPLAGDFDGNGREDVAWYGPGGIGDAIWWSTPSGVTSGPLVAQ